MMDFSLRYFRLAQLFPRREPQPDKPSLAALYTFPLNFQFPIADGLFRRDLEVQQTVPQPADPRSKASYVDVKTEDADSDYDFIDDVFEAEAKMVQLVEVEDEHFQHAQEGPVEDDGDFTDTGTFQLFCFFSSAPHHLHLHAFARRCACDAIGQKIESITVRRSHQQQQLLSKDNPTSTFQYPEYLPSQTFVSPP